jgi:hypothetical protein
MARKGMGGNQVKVSHEFEARLRRLAPKDKVRAIVMLRANGGFGAREEQRGVNRRTLIDAVQSGAETALPHIDEILGRFRGKRLDSKPTSLGSVLVETTRAGIAALAASDYVTAILENQQISQLSSQASRRN